MALGFPDTVGNDIDGLAGNVTLLKIFLEQFLYFEDFIEKNLEGIPMYRSVV